MKSVFVIISMLSLGFSYSISARPSLQVTEHNVSTEISRLHFHHGLFGNMNIYKKRSMVRSQSPKVLVMLMGLHTDHNVIQSLNAPDDITLLAIDYPIEKNQPPKDQILKLITDNFRIQGLLASFFLWLKSAEDFKYSSIHLLMMSFGTYVAPKPLLLAEEFGFIPDSTIFAYGGAGLQHFYNPYLSDNSIGADDGSLLSEIKKLLEILFKGFENEISLTRLKGPFLVIQGSQDEVIPLHASAALYKALPEPKRLHVIEGPHIQEGRRDLIEEMMSVTLDWLNSQEKPQ